MATGIPNCLPSTFPWLSRFLSKYFVSIMSGTNLSRARAHPAALYCPIRAMSMLMTSGALPPAICVASLSQYSAVARAFEGHLRAG